MLWRRNKKISGIRCKKCINSENDRFLKKRLLDYRMRLSTLELHNIFYVFEADLMQELMTLFHRTQKKDFIF